MTVKSYPWLMKHSCILQRRMWNLSPFFSGQLSSHAGEESLLSCFERPHQEAENLTFHRTSTLNQPSQTYSSTTDPYLNLLQLNLIQNKLSTTPVSHIKVVAWLRTDSDTWQVLIKYGPLVPEGGRRDHRWATLTQKKFNCQDRGKQWPSTIFG
jgi:hypothetical protein